MAGASNVITPFHAAAVSGTPSGALSGATAGLEAPGTQETPGDANALAEASRLADAADGTRFTAAGERPPSRHASFSEECLSLWEKRARRDPDAHIVGMCKGAAVDVLPTDHEKIIWTYALAGCIAMFIHTETLAGVRSAVLTHYPPTQTVANCQKLMELIDANPHMREASARKRILIMALAEEMPTPLPTARQQRDPITCEIDVLILGAQAALGSHASLAWIPYRLENDAGLKDVGTFRITVPPFGRGPLSYRTWFGGGTIA